jgi:uncharacterized LabA/DUF88 family protein
VKGHHIAIAAAVSRMTSLVAMIEDARARGIEVIICEPLAPPPPVMVYELKKQSDEAEFLMRERKKDDPWRRERKDKRFK